MNIFFYTICRKCAFWVGLIMVFSLTSCSLTKPTRAFETYEKPKAPEYSDLAFWAAHPEKIDSADVIPDSDLQYGQESAVADVFFLHPTTYNGARGENQWNAPLDDKELNLETDRATIRNQATIFNACYKIYAPRYRQAHYKSYFTKRTKDAEKAFELAYQDVKNAFLYYLKNENNGRPVVIAGHSQGSTHAISLLREFFDGKDLSHQLVAAYIPGMLVRESHFDNITECSDSSETHCICTWRTLKEGHYPKDIERYTADDAMVVNPLSWSTNVLSISKEKNPGSVMLNFYDGLIYNSAGAKISGGFLWTAKPEFKGSFWLMTRNYHQGDFNLYYKSVRDNACHRLDEFLKTNAIPYPPVEATDSERSSSD